MNNSVKNTARLLGVGLGALLVLTLVSGATNLAGDNKDLIGQVEAAQKAVIKDNSTATYKVKKSDVPADAVTSSGSGLDPDYADLQVHRIAENNHLSVSQVDKLVKNHTSSRILGFMGEPRVNVLELNIALKDLAAKG
ncbi:potassium-transporting ATPase subunit C [Streptomyces sp. NBC_01474]|nr:MULTISPECIES: potassium-transporting ATPase subunit C [unclassified Streptomyces]WSE00131.1 potassium-transporting ATPase subunit C [Streptomyces sp. NBC_01474]